jgi:uncharacterized membrane protein
MSSELIVITYPTPEHAEQVVAAIRRLESEHLLELEDLEYCARTLDGRVWLYPSLQRPLHGAALGAFWGTFLGKCFDSPLLGAGLGAAGGALAGAFARSSGINDQFVRELSRTLAPGSSAVFALVKTYTPGKVLPVLGRFGGTVLHTSLSEAAEEQLQQALDEAHRRAAAAASNSARVPRIRRRRVLHRA